MDHGNAFPVPMCTSMAAMTAVTLVMVGMVTVAINTVTKILSQQRICADPSWSWKSMLVFRDHSRQLFHQWYS